MDYDALTAWAESRNRDYYPNGSPVRSPSGAMYAMQVMPSTASNPGFGIRPASGKSPDEYNRVGRDYRAVMEKRYGGDPAKMWAAYNWGPGNLDKAVRKHGDKWLAAAPAETKKYVRDNLAAMGQKDMNPMMDPAQRAKMFNVNIPPEQQPGQPFDLQQALAGVGQQILGPQLHASEPQPEEKKGIPMWAKILGVLGDSYTNIHGGHGAFIPAMQDRQRADDESNLARERLQQQIDAQRELLAAKLAAPQKPTQTDRYVQEVLDPNTPPARRALLRSILTHPMGIPIYGADGSQAMQYSYPDQMGGGEDDWEYSN